MTESVVVRAAAVGADEEVLGRDRRRVRGGGRFEGGECGRGRERRFRESERGDAVTLVIDGFTGETRNPIMPAAT